jgi:hypothetical protein
MVYEPSRTIPLVFDFIELRLRLPVRKADDLFMRDIGLTLPISRFL